MKTRHIKTGIICIVLPVMLYLIYIIFFKTTYSGSGWVSLDVPSWLKGEMSAAISGEPGPVLAVKGEETYVTFTIRFYDASTEELITDRAVLNRIVSMFTYTEEPFKYDEERSREGTCLFYYDGVFPENHPAALFSGFNGSGNNLSGGAGKIDRFYLKVQGGTMTANGDMEEVLDKFYCSGY